MKGPKKGVGQGFGDLPELRRGARRERKNSWYNPEYDLASSEKKGKSRKRGVKDRAKVRGETLRSQRGITFQAWVSYKLKLEPVFQ